MKEKFTLDKWQEAVLSTEGNITIRAGRQVGKSTIIAIKAARFALEKVGTTILVIAASQRQSSLIFEKIKSEIDVLVSEGKVEYQEEPTLTKIILKNKSRIYSLPAGKTGYFIRGFSIDLLICDEAAYIPEAVWKSVIPMIAVSQKKRGLGWIILLSTPFGRGGYFFHSFTDKDFRQFHVSSETCERIPKAFLLKERQRLTKQEYAQEYQAEFTEEYNQYFSTSLIKSCMTFIDWNFEKDFNKNLSYYCGVDIARYGGDENAFVIAEMQDNGNLKIVKALTTSRVSITDTIGRIIDLDNKFHFRRVFIDDAGVGGGCFDLLEEKIGRRVVGLNNAMKNLRGLMNTRKKEDLYSNALILMENHRVEMINDLGLLKSLKSMTFSYSSAGNVLIGGDYAHICEAFVRACWAVQEKGLKCYIA